MIFNSKDIIEKFIHSSGNGGQNVNKVATCVYLKYLPLNIEVKCQFYRTQAENRRMARKLLEAKILEIKKKEEQNKRFEFEKQKRANRKRPVALKENILKEKKFRSELKKLRKRIEF